MLKLNRLLTWHLVLLFLFVTSALAAAATTPASPDIDAAAWAKALYAAFTSHSWSVLTGLVMVGLVYPIRRWGGSLFAWTKTAFGGLVLAFVLALLGTTGSALAVGVAPSLSLAASSLATAATAAGVWEWLKAHIPGVQAAADKASSATPAAA